MMKYFYIPVLLLVLLASSCCKKKHYCRSGSLKIGFVGFQVTQVRSFVLRRYVEGDTLRLKALDSSQFVYTPSSSTTPGTRDTLWMSDYKSNGVLSGIYYGNDWTLTFPSSGLYYHISTIFDEEHRSEVVKCNDKETDCVNNIRHFSLNGAWMTGDLVYIVK